MGEEEKSKHYISFIHKLVAYLRKEKKGIFSVNVIKNVCKIFGKRFLNVDLKA